MFRFEDRADGIPKVGKITEDDDKTLFFIKCVYEMRDVSVLELIGKTFENFEVLDINITPADCAALFQFISCMKNLIKLSFRECIMGHIAIRELAKLLTKDTEITQLSLQHLNMKVRT